MRGSQQQAKSEMTTSSIWMVLRLARSWRERCASVTAPTTERFHNCNNNNNNNNSNNQDWFHHFRSSFVSHRVSDRHCRANHQWQKDRRDFKDPIKTLSR